MAISGFALMWIVIAVVAIIIEATTTQLVSIWFAIGAGITAVVSVFAEDLLVQTIVFVIVSTICLLITRPLAKKLKESTGEVPTNSDRYIGMIAEVIVDINNVDAVGQVKVEGSVWTARSSTGQVLPAGTKVVVNRIEGVKMIVTPVQVPQTTMV